MSDLTHLDERGRARMVDVSAKGETVRIATARGRVLMRPETLRLIRSGGVTKGDVLAIAQVAGVMGAKRTSDLIPLCHPLAITGVDLEFELDEEASAVEITAIARIVGKTGVEMEALTAVAVAALTVYDMCKAVDQDMVIDQIRLVHKVGGKSGEYAPRAARRPRVAEHGPIMAVGIITVSDKASSGEREDLGGPAIREMMLAAGAAVGRPSWCRTRPSRSSRQIKQMADERHLDLVLTTGGTGSPPATSRPRRPSPASTTRCRASPKRCAPTA